MGGPYRPVPQVRDGVVVVVLASHARRWPAVLLALFGVWGLYVSLTAIGTIDATCQRGETREQCIVDVKRPWGSTRHVIEGIERVDHGAAFLGVARQEPALIFRTKRGDVKVGRGLSSSDAGGRAQFFAWEMNGCLDRERVQQALVASGRAAAVFCELVWEHRHERCPSALVTAHIVGTPEVKDMAIFLVMSVFTGIALLSLVRRWRGIRLRIDRSRDALVVPLVGAGIGARAIPLGTVSGVVMMGARHGKGERFAIGVTLRDGRTIPITPFDYPNADVLEPSRNVLATALNEKGTTA